MPSGFLVLADGRCLARRWWAYDQVIRAVADSLEKSAPGVALRGWLLSLLPGPEDEEEIGIGAWHRTADKLTVVRHLDIRELTSENRGLFHDAALEAARRCAPDEDESQSLADLADMLMRADRGEPPLSRSDWREVVPSEGKRIGPGW
jgi:hypothetical protein